jgi:hypothetical protein
VYRLAPGPPLPCSSLRRPPQWRLPNCTVLPAPTASVPPRSRLCFVWPAPTWPAALSLLAFSLCASLVPCDTSSPTPTQRWPPTVPRRLRDADESDPHFRPRRLCSNVLRRARSDQDDQPAAGHAGARDGHCTLSSVTTLGPLCTKNCAPDKGIATPVHPYPVVPSVSRWPKTVSRNPVSHIPVYTVK